MTASVTLILTPDPDYRFSMTKTLIDLLGWIGAFSLLFAYGCVSFRKLRPDSLLYQLLNVLGSIFLVLNTAYYRAYPSAFVNVVWISIALAALVRLKGESRYSRQEPN